MSVIFVFIAEICSVWSTLSIIWLMTINMLLFNDLIFPGSVIGFIEYVTSFSCLFPISAMPCSQNYLSFPGPPLGFRFLINNLSPGSTTLKHGPVCNVLFASFSFLSEDFANTFWKASSISLFQLLTYSLWFPLGWPPAFRMRSIVNLGFLLNMR